jgi:uncharacterized protein YndB with AHSA1/START domain
MKVLKKVLFFLVAVIGLLLIVGFFAKKEYAVEREVVINKPKAEVFEYLKHLKNQEYFAVWNLMDPKAVKKYTGNDGEVGFVLAWDSQNENVGKGEQEIAKIVDGERIEVNLRFKAPMETDDDGYFITESISESQTKVKWGFHGNMSYPSNLMLLFMNMDQMLGKDLDQGLKNLKIILEK